MADDFKKPLISTKQVSCKINDISTEIVCSDFGDKYLVLITQYGKMGTLVQIGKESHMINNGDTENIDIKVLLGKDELKRHHLYWKSGKLEKSIAQALC
ncbi:proteasome assembly chaperone 3-like isoform X2 [Dendronephthya gigantea]|uniref:proteasome assembly chaperone 3-like isoform X2 n=1 Tax=Dendronephthya gigantea TaxID=151771 RepID=UPI00106DC569|nr:proteasome assembly chaperone 3-like isoform X2 [Dendronephthya gigantea]